VSLAPARANLFSGFYPSRFFRSNYRGRRKTKMDREKTETVDIPIDKKDLSYDVACRAYSGISFTPERRAKTEQEAYFELMSGLYLELKKEADGDDQRALLKIEFIQFKREYLRRYQEILSAKSRTMSTMITGATKFPTARNRKKFDREQTLFESFQSWKTKAIRNMRKRVFPQFGPMISGEPDTLARLKEKLEKLEASQEKMKAINKAVRKKDIEGLKAMGISTGMIDLYMKPNIYGKVCAFEPYQFQNQNAEIRRVKERIEQEEVISQRVTKERSFDGGQVIENVEENRLQIFFDEKPDEETRSQLKQNGFRWSPSRGVWQRQLTDAALASLSRVIDV